MSEKKVDIGFDLGSKDDYNVFSIAVKSDYVGEICYVFDGGDIEYEITVKAKSREPHEKQSEENYRQFSFGGFSDRDDIYY